MQNARLASLIPHRWPGAPLEAVLESRPNRFLAICRFAGRSVEAHVPDRGRCLNLLVAGRRVVIVEAGGPLRRTGYTALLVRAKDRGGPWVSLDPAGAPRLVAAALEVGLLPSLGGLRAVAHEVPWRGSRLDLLLADRSTGRRLAAARSPVLCEVKSVGAARAGVALFPDAPTLRGARHLRLLAHRARGGSRAALIFCAQRSDVRAIAPDAAIDPAFADALADARRAGVAIAGLVCAAEPGGMRLVGEVPVLG